MATMSGDVAVKPKKEAPEPFVCAKCSAKVPAESRYCNMCGSALRTRMPRLNPSSHNSPSPPVKTIRQAASGDSHEIPAAVTRETAAGATRNDSHPPAQHSRPATRKDFPSSAQHGGPLKRFLEIIQSHQDIPAFSLHIVGVMGLVGQDEASLRHLTNMILNDYSLTLAVLRLANSAYYNRSGKPVCSVARAITMMGIDAIKRVAGGLLLLENYEKHPAGLKELLLLSILTASHARQAALQIHLPDSEKAYLCGMFRNLGEILVALHFSSQYEEIQKEIHEHKLSEHDACLKIMEFSYEELGRAIAGSWGLPEPISHAMETQDPKNYREQSQDKKLLTLVAFSHDLTRSVYSHPPEERNKVIDVLLEKYSAIAGMNRQVLKDVIDGAATDAKDTFAAVGVPLTDLRIVHQGSPKGANSNGPRASGNDGPATGDASIDPILAETSKDPNPEGDLLSGLVAEVKAAVEPGHELKLNEVLMMALEACHRGAHFARVVFCLATPDRSCIRGRLGLGPDVDKAIESLQIPLSGQHEALTLDLLAKRDLFIDAQNDDRYRESPLVRALSPSCFGLYPIVVDGVVVGCLYFDRTTPDSVPPRAILDTIGYLRDMVADMIRRTRAHS